MSDFYHLLPNGALLPKVGDRYRWTRPEFSHTLPFEIVSVKGDFLEYQYLDNPATRFPVSLSEWGVDKRTVQRIPEAHVRPCTNCGAEANKPCKSDWTCTVRTESPKLPDLGAMNLARAFCAIHDIVKPPCPFCVALATRVEKYGNEAAAGYARSVKDLREAEARVEFLESKIRQALDGDEF